jgi:D-glucosaminate-specific PTS system IIB component
MKTVLELAAPAGLQLDVLTVEDGVRALASNAPDRATTMVLVKSAAAARRLHEGGARFDALNVGGIAGGPGRTNVFRNIALSSQDFADLQHLVDQGVEVVLQTMPGERARDFSDLADMR